MSILLPEYANVSHDKTS